MTEPEPDTTDRQRLYALLPAVYRIARRRDRAACCASSLARASPTRSTRSTRARAALRRPVHRDLRRLGRAVHRRPDRLPPAARRRARASASPRAEVANTIALPPPQGHRADARAARARRHRLAGRAVVEFFEQLATTQYMNHVRPHALATADLRDHDGARPGSRRRTARSTTSRTPPTCAGSTLRRRPARAATTSRTSASSCGAPRRCRRRALAARRTHAERPTRFRFDPLGADAPLFARRAPRRDITHLAEPLRRAAAARPALASATTVDGRYYGARAVDPARAAGRAPADPVPIAGPTVRICDLSRRPGGAGLGARAAGRQGRDRPGARPGASSARRSPPATRLLATFHYGTGAFRSAAAASRPRAHAVAPASRSAQARAGGGALQPSSTPSRRAARCGSPTPTATTAPSRSPPTTARPASRTTSTVRSWPRRRAPALIAREAGPARHRARARRVVLDGLVIAGGPLVLDEVGDDRSRARSILRHCTLVPGHDRTADGLPRRPARQPDRARPVRDGRTLERCVTGPIVAVEGAVVDDQRLRRRRVGGATAVAICGRGRGRRARAPSRRRPTWRSATGLAGRRPPESRRVARWSAGSTHDASTASNRVLLAALAGRRPAPAPPSGPSAARTAACASRSLPPGSRTARRFRCAARPRRSASERRATCRGSRRCATATRATCSCAPATPAAIRTRRRRRERDGRDARPATSRSARRNLRMRLDEYLRFGLAGRILLRDLTTTTITTGQGTKRWAPTSAGCGSTRAATTPAWSSSRAACCSTPTATSWSRSSTGGSRAERRRPRHSTGPTRDRRASRVVPRDDAGRVQGRRSPAAR